MFANDDSLPSYSQQDPNLPPEYSENENEIQEFQSNSSKVQEPVLEKATPAPIPTPLDHDHLFVRIDPELPPLASRFPRRAHEHRDDWISRLEILYRITYSTVPARSWTFDMCRKWIFELLSTELLISSTVAHQTTMKWPHGDMLTCSVEYLNDKLGEGSGTLVYNRLCAMGLRTTEPPKAKRGTKGTMVTKPRKMVMQRAMPRAIENLPARRLTHPHLFTSNDHCVTPLYQRFPRTEGEAEKEWIERLEVLYNITYASVPEGDWTPDMCQKWIYELLTRVMPSDETAYSTGQHWKGEGRDLFDTDEQAFREILGWGGQCVYETVAKLCMEEKEAGRGTRLQ